MTEQAFWVCYRAWEHPGLIVENSNWELFLDQVTGKVRPLKALSWNEWEPDFTLWASALTAQRKENGAALPEQMHHLIADLQSMWAFSCCFQQQAAYFCWLCSFVLAITLVQRYLIAKWSNVTLKMLRWRSPASTLQHCCFCRNLAVFDFLTDHQCSFMSDKTGRTCH